MSPNPMPLPGADPAAPIHRDSWGVSALLAGQMTCYFDVLPGDARGLVAAYERVAAAVASQWTWARSDSNRRSHPIEPKDVDAFATWFSTARRRATYGLVASAGTVPGEIGASGFSFSLETASLPDVLGYFQFWVPAAWLAADPDAFERLARGVFGDFAWRWASAGYGIAFDADDIDPKRDAAIHAFARRYRGVDCNDLLAETELPRNTFKSVNWLTFLGPETARAASIGTTRSEHVRVDPLAEGAVCVRAGDRPVVGDVNRREDVSAYTEADRLLRRARVRRMWPLPGFQDEDEAAEWLARFESDEPDDPDDPDDADTDQEPDGRADAP